MPKPNVRQDAKESSFNKNGGKGFENFKDEEGNEGSLTLMLGIPVILGILGILIIYCAAGSDSSSKASVSAVGDCVAIRSCKDDSYSDKPFNRSSARKS